MIYEFDPSQNLDIRPSTEHDEVRRRRFFSRGGGLAVKSMEQSEVLTAELGFSEEFGVEQQMGEYRALWGEYSDSVETFSNDEEAHQLYDEMTGFGSAEANASRSDKRKLMPRRDKDFAEVVLATALTSRVIGTSGSDAMQASDSGLGMVKDVINTNKRLRGKLYGIVSNFRPSTARDAFEGKIADFESLVRRKHTKIAKIEDKVIEDIAAKTKDPATALRLIEGFIDTGSSEATDDKTFVRFLSTYYALQSKGSLLGQALERMRESAGEGGLAKNFLQSKMEEREGDNLYAYMARKLESAGLQERFDDVFARDFSEWPADMRAEYEEFTNQYLTSLSTSVHRIASQNIAKLWVRPSKAMCETFLDDLFHRFHGKYSASSAQKLAQSERQGTMRIGANVQISVIDGVQNTDTQSKKEKLEPKTLGVIAKGMNGVAVWQHEGISTEDVIKLFIKDHKISREFRSELITIIEKIRREPFGEGTQLLRLGKRKPDSTKFYRINPVQAGMPVADAKKARVIYALNGDQLGIYSITNNHDEYERVIRDLLGSKM